MVVGLRDCFLDGKATWHGRLGHGGFLMFLNDF